MEKQTWKGFAKRSSTPKSSVMRFCLQRELNLHLLIYYLSTIPPPWEQLKTFFCKIDDLS